MYTTIEITRKMLLRYMPPAALIWSSSSYIPTILAAAPLPSCILIGITVTLAPEVGSRAGFAKFSMAYMLFDSSILCAV